MAFLNYAITQNDNGTYEIKLINKKIVEGTFKKKAYKKYTSTDRYISCNQLDGKSNTLDLFEIKDPLNTYVEYVNGEENLAVKEIYLKETVFFVRIPLEKEATEIRLTMVDPTNKRATQLITTKI
ncbi:hypothetical protein [Dokdonia sp.]|uniref:hypothetical protein n=1 Tax=Dokdonia sp. TaxID=2024995 RepID=UPI003264DBE5